ncbi:hypothetical protein LSH36_1780g00001 [Paralvinella palmiformis]|uniref:Uncharacterized protein n=1 Tax=Paralvinella palmiformis TaxID=53620 RepID=A0AAD9MQP8_9ANNE|nr:hypothetical protein LSH36_1780g00001 [Paralvinella palmiformis]
MGYMTSQWLLQRPPHPATTTTDSSVGLSSIGWFESSRARSALFPSSAIKLDQFDGRVTATSFSILRRTDRWCCLHLVLVPVLIDSS